MPTSIWQNVRVYHEAMKDLPSLPAQLGWVCRRLRIDARRLLPLFGTPPADAADVEALAAARPDDARWVMDLFKQLIDRAGYDLERLAASIHSPPEPGSATRSAALAEIARGGPQAYTHLLEYLRLPPEDETPPNREP